MEERGAASTREKKKKKRKKKGDDDDDDDDEQVVALRGRGGVSASKDGVKISCDASLLAANEEPNVARSREQAITRLLYDSLKPKEESSSPFSRKSSLLSQVRSFLPKIAKANEVLTQLGEKEKAELDIECLNSESYVQLDLAVAPTEAVDALEDTISKAVEEEKAAGSVSVQEISKGREGRGGGDGDGDDAGDEKVALAEDKANKKRKLIEEL